MVKQPYRDSLDMRELGFALTGAEWTTASMARPAILVSKRRKLAVAGLLKMLCAADKRPLAPVVPKAAWNGAPGVAVLIPARGPVEVLQPCLESLQEQQTEEIVVLVNGSDREEYRGVERAFPAAAFYFVDEPLGLLGPSSGGLD